MRNELLCIDQKQSFHMTGFEILVVFDCQKGGKKNGQNIKQNMFSRLKFSVDFISEVKNT